MNINSERYRKPAVAGCEAYVSLKTSDDAVSFLRETLDEYLAEGSLITRIILESAEPPLHTRYPYREITFTIDSRFNLKTSLISEPDLPPPRLHEQTLCCNLGTEFSLVGGRGIYRCKRCGRQHKYYNRRGVCFKFVNPSEVNAKERNSCERVRLHELLQKYLDRYPDLPPLDVVLAGSALVEIIEALIFYNFAESSPLNRRE